MVIWLNDVCRKHTELEKSTDSLWASQAQSCCLRPRSPKLSVQKHLSQLPNPTHGQALLGAMLRPRAPHGRVPPAQGLRGRHLAGATRGGGEANQYSLLLRTSPEGSLAIPSVLCALWTLPCSWADPGPCREHCPEGQLAGSWDPVPEGHWLVTCRVSPCHCTMAASSMGIKGTLSSTFLN